MVALAGGVRRLALCKSGRAKAAANVHAIALEASKARRTSRAASTVMVRPTDRPAPARPAARKPGRQPARAKPQQSNRRSCGTRAGTNQPAMPSAAGRDAATSSTCPGRHGVEQREGSRLRHRRQRPSPAPPPPPAARAGAGRGAAPAIRRPPGRRRRPASARARGRALAQGTRHAHHAGGDQHRVGQGAEQHDADHMLARNPWRSTKAFWAPMATMSPRLRARPWTNTGKASAAVLGGSSCGELARHDGCRQTLFPYSALVELIPCWTIGSVGAGRRGQGGKFRARCPHAPRDAVGDFATHPAAGGAGRLRTRRARAALPGHGDRPAPVPARRPVRLLEQELQQALPALARRPHRVSLPVAVNADSLATWFAPPWPPSPPLHPC